MSLNPQRNNPNAQVSEFGPNRAGETGAVATSDAVISMMSPPKFVDMGAMTDYQSFLGMDPFNAYAVEFGGTDEYLSVANHSDFDFNYDSAFSVSMWIKTGQSGWNGLISKAENSGTGGAFKGWNIAMYNGKIYIFNAHDWSSGTGTGMGANGGSGLTNDEWRNVIITFDGTGTVAGTSIYIDSSSQTVSSYYLDNLGTDSLQNTEPVRVGASPINGVGFSYFIGEMDEVSVWEKELSAAEVDEIWGVGTPSSLTGHSAASDLVSWWRMGDGGSYPNEDSTDSSDATARIYDESSNSHNLTPNNMEESDITTDAP